jgi:hypothetical protein
VQPPRCGINQVGAQVLCVAMGVPSQCSPHLERPPVALQVKRLPRDLSGPSTEKRLKEGFIFF